LINYLLLVSKIPEKNQSKRQTALARYEDYHFRDKSQILPMNRLTKQQEASLIKKRRCAYKQYLSQKLFADELWTMSDVSDLARGHDEYKRKEKKRTKKKKKTKENNTKFSRKQRSCMITNTINTFQRAKKQALMNVNCV